MRCSVSEPHSLFITCTQIHNLTRHAISWTWKRTRKFKNSLPLKSKPEWCSDFPYVIWCGNISTFRSCLISGWAPIRIKCISTSANVSLFLAWIQPGVPHVCVRLPWSYDEGRRGTRWHILFWAEFLTYFVLRTEASLRTISFRFSEISLNLKQDSLRIQVKKKKKPIQVFSLEILH